MSEQITLYDLPSRPPCHAWSPNSWKTRIYLNYKKIPYKTEWIEYPDLTTRFSPHLSPNPEGSIAPYTIPTVILPDGTYIQDSLVINKKLEELYPSPALKLESKYLDILAETIPAILPIVAPEHLYNVPTRLLNERSSTWWFPDRERRIGGTKLETFRDEKGGAQVTKGVAPHIKKLGELLKENPGPFFEGDQVTFADFVWVSWLRFFERIGQDTFDLVVVEERDAHLKLFEACRPWLARDDH